MNQFRIKGIDYPDDSLQHGIGKGSGRGRPLGSKNGQVMPGAAYMKDYKIVGHKAEEDLTSSGAAQKNYTTERGLRTVGSANRNQQARAQQERVNRLRSQNAQRTQQARTTAPVSRPATPSEKIDAGKELINKGFKWSAKNVNDAGGIQSRAGRQIIYENPTLSDDYKKQVAKKYGDSDGRSYPKAASTPLVGGPTQANISDQANSINTVDNPNDWQRRERADTVGRRDARYVNANAGHTAPITSYQSAPTTVPAETASPEPSQPDVSPEYREVPENNSRQNAHPDVTAVVQEESKPAQTNVQPQAQPQPAPQQQETPEQKSLWDSVGGWFSQAGKDIGDAASSAWNTVSGAASDAAKWVGDRLGEAGEWANTAVKDVSDWVGARANEFNTWLNGQQVVVADRNGPNLTSRYEYQPGVLGNAGRWLGDTANNVGQWVGNAANDVGQTVNNVAGDIGRGLGNWWNGRDVEVNQNGRWVQGHEPGFRENVVNAVNGAGQMIGNVAGDVSQGVNNLWNGRDVEVNQNGRWVQGHEPGIRENIGNALGDIGRAVGGAANAAGQLVGNAAGDVGQWVGARAQDVSNFVNGVQPGTLQGAPYWDVATGQYVDPSMPSLAERFGTAANNAGQWLGNAATDAWNSTSDWVGNNIVAPVSNAVNGVGNFVRDTASNVGQAVNNAGQAISDFAGNAADAINAMPGAAAGLTRALTSGVPAESARRLTNNYINGQITRDEYEESIDRLINESGPWGSEKPTGIGQTVNNAWNDVSGAVNNAGQWIGDTVQNAGNAIGTATGYLGSIRPMTSSDGSVRDVYYPGIADKIAEARGEVPDYVRQYYDRSNPNREAYWPAVLSYYNSLAPGSTDNLIVYNRLRNRNPFEGK